MNERDRILNDIAQRKDLKTVIHRMTEGDKYYREELTQELYIVLCSLPTEKLIKMYEEGWLMYYIIRTLNNLFNSSTSTFYTKIKRKIVNKAENVNSEGLDRMDILPADDSVNITPILLEEYDKVVETLSFFDRGVLELYLELGSIRKTAAKTNINYNYIGESLNRTKRELKKIITENLNNINDN